MQRRVSRFRCGATAPANAALALILLLGLCVRVWPVAYDQGMASHPDERSNSYYGISLAWPSNPNHLWAPRQSPLNPFWDVSRQTPRNFTYGHLPLYLGTVFAALLSQAAPLLEAAGGPATWVATARQASDDAQAFRLAGRFVMALLDTATIGLLYLIARRTYTERTALLGALLYALALMPVKDSHFFTFDVASAAFVALAVYGSLTMVQEPDRMRGWVLAGLGIGWSVASKFSALPAGALPLVAVGLEIWARRPFADRRAGLRALGAGLGRVAAVWAIAVLAFALTSPFVLLDWERFRTAVWVEQGAMVRGAADFPFTRQYRGTVPYLYFIRQQLQWGLGYPLGVTALLGVGWGALRVLFAARPAFARWLPRGLPAEILMLAWIIPYFGLTGAFLAKFNRYMIPVLPFAVLFGAAFLAWFCGWWGRRRNEAGQGQARGRPLSPWRVWIGTSGLLLVVAGAVFWLGAHMNGIYAREHTWRAASKWVYANVPDGAVILWELWDDPLPKPASALELPSQGAGRHKQFRMLEWSPFDNDTPAKLAVLKAKLRAADYVIYSSRRIYGAVPKLPLRYPMTIAYYDAMFNGALGFAVVHEETRRMRAFGLRFDDSEADESWRLYDHPPVTILAKTRALTDAEMDRILAPPLAQAIPDYLPPGSFLDPLLARLGLGHAAAPPLPVAPAHVAAPPGSPLAQFVFGADTTRALDYSPARGLALDRYRFNTAASASPWLAAVTWWGALLLLGALAWPFCFRLFARLPDRGYALARLAGWLVWALGPWWLAHAGVRAFTVAGVWTSCALLGAGGVCAGWLQRKALRRFWTRRWPLLLGLETGFALAFAFFVLIRLGNPDLWQPWTGGEKFMDMAIINGILHSPVFPPLDPHFAGKYLNYYYWGHYLVAALIKLTGVWPEVAYNLALPAFYALTALLAWSAVFYFHMRPSRGDASAQDRDALPWRPALTKALWSPLLLVGIGNLDGGLQLLGELRAQAPWGLQSYPLPTWLKWPLEAAAGFARIWREGRGLYFDYWAPSRVFPETISEFPAWSFLFGDLHAHLLALPLTLALCCCVVYAIHYVGSGREVGFLLVAAGGLAGATIATNLWEMPLTLCLAAIAIALAARRLYPRAWGRRALAGGGLFLLSGYILLWPFWRTYELVAPGGVGQAVTGDAAGLWLKHWGLFYAIVLSWLCLEFRRAWSDGRYASRRVFWNVSLLLATVGAAGALQHETAALLLPPLWLTAALIRRDPRAALREDGHVLWWVGLLLAMWLGMQILFVKDFLQAGGYFRMNTVFKFSVQAWVLASLIAAMVLPGMWSQVRGWLGPGRAAASAAPLGALLLVSLVFPLLGTPFRLADRFRNGTPPTGTLNGLDYMRTGIYHWPDDQTPIHLRYDREAIDWLNQNVSANVPILEAAEVDYYRAGGTRVASFTGLPGLLGMHQPEQRDGTLVGRRSALLHTLWHTEDAQALLALLRANHIGLIYAGQLERTLHPETVQLLRTMSEEGLLALAYENPGAAIYALPDARRKLQIG